MRWAARARCEHRGDLDVAWLRRRGLLEGYGHSTLTWTWRGAVTGSIRITGVPGGVRLTYRARSPSEDWEDVEERIRFVATPTNFGAQRIWLECPGCGTARGVLYGGTRFRCRECLGLAYASQLERPWWRRVSAARKIRRRLGGSASLAEPIPFKPRTMHWKTYRRLADRCLRLEGSLSPASPRGR
jgi:hypothetical protein